MKYEKRVIGSLEKCYSVCRIEVDGTDHLLVAAEKQNACLMFSSSGDYEQTVWEGPGGVMTMTPVPGRQGQFLATHMFYSPNDSAHAKLVWAEKTEECWKVSLLCELPFVHRFDVFESGGRTLVLACTLKSAHEYKNDWRSPGKLWAGVLPEKRGELMSMTPIAEGLSRNHGYTRSGGRGIVSCDQGVFEVFPECGCWKIRKLLDIPCSDAVKADLDGDGLDEIFAISPFHGDKITIWHEKENGYVKVYSHPCRLPFLHAITSGAVFGKTAVFVGAREGGRELLCFTYEKGYRFETVDSGAGCANCMLFEKDGAPRLLAANRETDEIAVYDISL